MKVNPMLERIAKYFTYGGACMATSCGYAGGGTLGGPVITLADLGLVVGIGVGLFGALIQYFGWRDRRDTKRREDALKEAELAYLKGKDERERIEHEARISGLLPDRRTS